jgi:uncharacterized protein YkwD
MKAPTRRLVGAFVMPVAIAAAAALLAGCAGTGRPAADGTGADGSDIPADPAAYAAQLTQETNDVRVSQGIDRLTPSRCAEAAARQRAADLVGAELTHAPLTGVVKDCAPGGRAAENLVDSVAAPRDVVEAWMSSPGHRNNIIDPKLRQMGIGCIESDGGMLCSQLFVGPE